MSTMRNRGYAGIWVASLMMLSSHISGAEFQWPDDLSFGLAEIRQFVDRQLGYEAWTEENYLLAAQLLARARLRLEGDPQLDYWLASAWCRQKGKEADGLALINYALDAYTLGESARSAFLTEQKLCKMAQEDRVPSKERLKPGPYPGFSTPLQNFNHRIGNIPPDELRRIEKGMDAFRLRLGLPIRGGNV